MKVLIGITSKNRCSILPQAIESALAQSYENKEIWVFDDASTDETRSLEKHYPNVKWFFSDEPHGYVYARNFMMGQEQFDLFCSLDDDSWFLDSELLATSVSYLERHPDVGAIAYDILSPDRPAKNLNKIVVSDVNTFIGCGHLLRLSVAKSVGFYIPNPGYYGGEEKDLSIRIWDSKFKVVKFGGGYIWHDKTPVARNLESQHRSGVCNDLIFCARRMPTLIVLPYFLYKIYSHLCFALKYKSKSLVVPTLHGVGDFAGNLFLKRLYRRPVKLSTLKVFLKLSHV